MRRLLFAFLALGLLLSGCAQEAAPEAQPSPEPEPGPAPEAEAPAPVAECTDTDGGKDVYVQGRADSADDTGTDACLGTGEFVIEYYCENGELAYEDIACPEDYICMGGACVERLCMDSDGGEDIRTLGFVQYGVDRYNDACENSAVKEYHCSSGKPASTVVDCPAGQQCEDGACTGAPICIDTDEGKKYFIAGTATFGTESKSDYCRSAVIVVEYYCGTSEILEKEYVCPGLCEDGECVESGEGECRDTDDGQDIYEEGTVTYGSFQTSVTDTCYDNGAVLEHWCTDEGNLGLAIMECPGGMKCRSGECVD